MRRTLSLVLLVATVLVAAAGCAVLRRAGTNFWELERGPSGQAPDPVMTPEPVVQVYAARTVGLRGLFAVHTWIAVKPREAMSYTRYEVIGWDVDRGAPAVRVNRAGPDNYWFGDRPERLVDLRATASTRSSRVSSSPSRRIPIRPPIGSGPAPIATRSRPGSAGACPS